MIQKKKKSSRREKRSASDPAVLDGYKELTPVLYGKDAFKYLYYHIRTGGQVLFEKHWHERMEILRVVSGSMELSLGEECFSVGPGQAAVLTPRMLHGGRSGPDGVEYHTIMFDLEKLCNATSVSEKYLKPVSRCEVGFDTVVSKPEVLIPIDRLTDCLGSQKNENPLLTMGIVYEILGMLYEHALGQPKETIRVNREFSEVLDYINSHFCEKLSAKMLSEYFNYNETYFCRRFKVQTGLTVMKYVQTLRLEEAQRLLENTTEGIGVIAGKCGFSDTCYFSNCFRKQFGYTPTKFRSYCSVRDQ